MSIKQIDRDFCRTLTSEIDEALKSLGEKYGIKFSRNAGRFDATVFKLAIEFSVLEDGGIPATFGKGAALLGLKPEDYGKTIVHDGDAYKIVDIQLRRHKFPIVVERISDKRRILLTAQAVVKFLRTGPVMSPFKDIAPTTPLSPEMKRQFDNLASQLSPENLSCDGELSQSEVNAKYRTLTAQWKALEAEVGRKVTEDELYQ